MISSDLLGIRNFCSATNTSIARTKYSSEKIKGGLCEIRKINVSSEIHHLEYQRDAVEGFIKNKDNTFNKNHPANLINICETCHDNLHKVNKKYKKKKGTNGYELV